MSDESTVKTWPSREWLNDFTAGFTAYYLTGLPVILGFWFGVSFLPKGDPIDACIRFDAIHYVDIIRNGYSYDPNHRSVVAQFPAYPLLARWLCQITGLSTEEGALLTANFFLMGAFVLLARWVGMRWPEAPVTQRGVVLAVFGLWPLGLFFRMPYAESLFVCGTLAVLYGMARDWPVIVLGVLSGFVTAVRPVGVAVTAAFLWHVLTRPGMQLRGKAGQVLMLVPLACWGLLTYMIYQWLTFGTPWGFAQTQEHWSMLAPEDHSWLTKLRSLLTLEPIWGVYVPTSGRYWAKVSGLEDPLFYLIFWNPILFVLAAALQILGGWKRWLTGSELICGMCLLAIPYVTRSYEMYMASHGRFAAVVVTNYLVIGRLLAHASPLIVAGVCSALALWIFIFTCLFAMNHSIF